MRIFRVQIRNTETTVYPRINDEREKTKNMMSKNIIAETSLNNKVTLNYFWPLNRIRIRHSEMAKFDINYFPF